MGVIVRIYPGINLGLKAALFFSYIAEMFEILNLGHCYLFVICIL